MPTIPGNEQTVPLGPSIPPGEQTAPATNIEKVRQWFLTYLKREPDQAGLNTFVSQLNAGKNPAIIENYLKTVGAVRDMYVNYLHREPDTAGLNTYVNQIISGRQKLTNIDAYLKKAGTIRDQVAQTYIDLFGREGDEQGINDWTTRILAGKVNINTLKTEILKTPEAKNIAPYRKLIKDWYSQKPNTPEDFSWTPEQEAFEKTAVEQEYRPYYQEQIDISNQDYAKILQEAKQGYSRKGLWGAAEGTTAGGPVSGIRQVGLGKIGEKRQQSETAFERAYTEATAGGLQNRRAQAQDVWQKTIYEPYQEQYKDWQNRLNLLQSQNIKV